MTVYFCCTSVFHLFVTYILTSTVYSDKKYSKVIILDKHVDNLLFFYPNLKTIDIWNQIILIERNTKTHDEVIEQFKALDFQINDIFHCFGVDDLTFTFIDSLPFDGQIIYTEEGYSTGNLEMFHQKLKKDFPNWNSQFPINKVKEIWMFDAKMSNNHFKIPVKDISFLHYLEDKSFKEQFISGLLKIFMPHSSNLRLDMGNIYFFDQYLSSSNKISIHAERYILSKISELNKFTQLIVKPHPGENPRALKKKYEGLEFELLLFHNIPWEVLYLLSDNLNNSSQKILMTYNSSSLLNQRILFADNNSHLIFLNNILDRYYGNKTDMFHIDKFISIYGSENLYFPQSFSELYEIICGIKQINFNRAIIDLMSKEEMLDELKWLREEHLSTWRALPKSYNVSTLYYDCGVGFEDYQEIDFPLNESCGDFDITFDIPDKCRNSLKHVKWYALRGRNVKIKIKGIFYTNMDDSKFNIDLSQLTYHGIQTEDGYIKCYGFDPCFFISITEIAKQIELVGSWEVDNTYESAVVVANIMAENLGKRLDNALIENASLQSQAIGFEHLVEVLNDNNKINQQTIEGLNEQIQVIQKKLGQKEKRIFELEETTSQLSNSMNSYKQEKLQDENQIKELIQTIASYEKLQVMENYKTSPHIYSFY